MHPRPPKSLCAVLLASAALFAAAPAPAADVTAQRLANPEPQNWLMNHRTYDAPALFAARRGRHRQRQGPQARLAVANRREGGERDWEATPLAEDGFLYVVDQWGVLYKMDARSGDAADRLADGSRAGEGPAGQPRRRAVGQVRDHGGEFSGPRMIATDKDTGKVAWETKSSTGRRIVQLTAAPLPVKDKIVIGAFRRRRRRARLHRGARCRDRQAGLAANT